MINELIVGALVFTSSLVSGERQYLSMHGEEGHWDVELTSEVPSQLPSLVWKKSFTREPEARQFVAEFSRRKSFLKLTKGFKTLSQAASTEVHGTTLWPVTQEWSWEWEQRYAEWVRTEVDHLFFKKHSISTDCADVAYSLRWIFSRIHGLPAANRLSGSGVMFSQDSMKSEWADLPTSAHWNEDRRFLAALNYLLTLTYTHTLIEDSYPITISGESMTPGVHHLSLHGTSGHTMFVARMDLTESSILPLEFIYSTTPREIRELMKGGYWNTQQPQEGLGGFLRIRWPLLKNGDWKLTPPQNHPHFSKEQFTDGFMQGHSSFAEAILLKLSPNLDFRARLREGIRYLKDQIQVRVGVVENGFEACKNGQCPPDSAKYDDWSTPSRDARVNELLDQLTSMIQSMQSIVRDLPELWTAAKKEATLTLDGETYSLGEVMAAWKLKTYSSDPTQPIAVRWGLAARPFASAIALQFETLLQERMNRIERQADHCASINDCAPGTEGWSQWHTIDLDQRLHILAAYGSETCVYGSKAHCDGLFVAAQSTQVNSAAGSRTLSSWIKLTSWLIADPRSPREERWGSQKAHYESTAFRAGNESAVSTSGLYLAGNVLIDLPNHVEISPPAGFEWQALAPDLNWAIATREDAASSTIVFQVLINGTELIFERALPLQEGIEFKWNKTGVLTAIVPDKGVWLYDLTRTPIFEAEALPLSTAPTQSYLESLTPRTAWVAGPALGPLELISYADGKVTRVPTAAPEAPFKFGSLVIERLGYVVGPIIRCENPDCTTLNYEGSYAIEKKTGKLLRSGSDQSSLSEITQDGKYTFEYFRETPGSSGGTFLNEVNERLETISKRFVGKYVIAHNHQSNVDYFKILEDHFEGKSHILRYDQSTWSEFRLLANEKRFGSMEGEFVQTSLAQGTRIRKLDGSEILSELPKSEIVFAGSRDSGHELPVVLVSYPEHENWWSVINPRNPSRPILTGPIQFNREGPYGSAQIVQRNGMLVSFAGGRRLWFKERANR